MSTSSTDNPASTIRKYPMEKIEQGLLPNLKTGIGFGVLLDHAKFICIQSPVLAAPPWTGDDNSAQQTE